MSTVTADPTPAADPTSLRFTDPAAVVARTRPRTSVAETIEETLLMAWRALKKMRLPAASLTFVMGLILGYRPGGGVLGVLGAILLAIFTGWAIAWVFTWIGTIAKSARAAAQGMSMMVLFPLIFLSNAFVPISPLPGWLAAFVKVNPVSHLVSATRELADHGVITAEVGWTLLAGLAVIAVFAPLSVRSYRRQL